MDALPDGTKPLVFISYDFKDRSIAIPLAKALRSAGFRTWVYEEDSLPGPSYLEQIVDAIREADVLAIVISCESLRSVHVRKELFRGYESGKALLPILRDLTHADFKLQSPEVHQALVTNVAIPIPPEGIQSVIDRILAGIEAMIHKRFGFADLRAPEAIPCEGAPRSATTIDPWDQMKSRRRGFSDEITQLRGRLERAWHELSQRCSAAHGWKSLALERVKLADEIVQEVLAYVIGEEEFTPRDYALIARGGYGRGFLSEGSDVDITLLFAEDVPVQAKPFWARFEQTLVDVWGAVRCIRVSPLATSVIACVRDWRRVFLEEDAARPALFVSFAYSRCLAGSAELHERLREEWRQLARTATPENMDCLVRKLKQLLQSAPIHPLADSFNLKNDGGGVLEFRLTGFIEQFLSCRSIQIPSQGIELAQAHEFFLVLRDQLYRLTRTPKFARPDAKRLNAAIAKELGGATAATDLWDRLMRHRLTVRSGFKQALDRLAQAPALN